MPKRGLQAWRLEADILSRHICEKVSQPLKSLLIFKLFLAVSR